MLWIAFITVALLLVIPASSHAWIDNIYELEDTGLISGAEADAAMEYLWEIGFLTHHQTVTYSVSGYLGLVPNQDIPNLALQDALDSWENANPGLRFVAVDDGTEMDTEMDVVWTHKLQDGRAGEANCRTDVDGIDCQIIIGLGNYDCNGKFVQREHLFVQNIITHEVGHALGLGHTDDSSHLMYGHMGVPTTYWNGYVVPGKHAEWFVGQEALYADVSELTRAVSRSAGDLESIGRLTAEVDRVLAGLEKTIGVIEADMKRIEVEMTVVKGTQLKAMEMEHTGLAVEHSEAAERHEWNADRRAELDITRSFAAERYEALLGQLGEAAGAYACYPNAMTSVVVPVG